MFGCFWDRAKHTNPVCPYMLAAQPVSAAPVASGVGSLDCLVCLGFSWDDWASAWALLPLWAAWPVCAVWPRFQQLSKSLCASILWLKPTMWPRLHVTTSGETDTRAKQHCSQCAPGNTELVLVIPSKPPPLEAEQHHLVYV